MLNMRQKKKLKVNLFQKNAKSKIIWKKKKKKKI